MGVDLKDYLLASPMNRPEFMRIHQKYFPDEMSKQYNVDAISDADGYIYI